jgi:molecular chaperone GrpE
VTDDRHEPQAPPDVQESPEELAERLRQQQDRYLRLAADMENFRRRAQQERRETATTAVASVVERLLPALDDAERALAHVPEGTDEGWLRGVQLVVRKLQEVLASIGVRAIEAAGRPFDPRLHEAIEFEETDAAPEGTVVAELRRGYRLHDRVLRPALVRVARRAPEE